MDSYERKKLKEKMENELAGVGDEGPSICQLPSSILADILSRLPIKALIRCRCVCKSFHSTISADQEFPPLHLSRSPSELILCPITERIILVDYDNNDRSHHLNLLQFDGSYPLVVLNSCRGLLCFDLPFSSKHLFVINPVTLEFIIIPPPTNLIEEKYQNNHSTLQFGLGYSPRTDQYKALVIVYHKSLGFSTTISTFTGIITFGSSSSSSSDSSWRRTEDVPLIVFNPSIFSTYLNGFMNWMVKKNEIDCVLYFDFDNEKFGEIAMPPPFKTWQENPHEMSVVNLVVFEGRLSVCLLMDKKRMDVWIMKEYGDSNSWVKEITMEMQIPNHRWCKGAPLKYVNNDKTVVLSFMDDKTLVTYNLIQKTIVNINELPFPNDTFKALMHVPILLPLRDLIIGVDVHLITDLRHTRRELDKNWVLNLKSTSLLLESNCLFDSDSHDDDDDANDDDDSLEYDEEDDVEEDDGDADSDSE